MNCNKMLLPLIFNENILRGHHYMTVCVQFLNQHKMEDSTEFDISVSDIIEGELKELFQTFCQESSIVPTMVTNIYVVKTAGTMEEL